MYKYLKVMFQRGGKKVSTRDPRQAYKTLGTYFTDIHLCLHEPAHWQKRRWSLYETTIRYATDHSHMLNVLIGKLQPCLTRKPGARYVETITCP
ncbi:hypothetical protein AVEN_152685-1 [Araneus ventricosus]|uniref:Uncharacterized protein n=1 Tax=Araneus ventricosus TaxID=182803 RepID=A0A4Y2HWK5_ARAVE|nr:hypothetical protein AVEN_152685-1 [Araneus ventricosus]